MTQNDAIKPAPRCLPFWETFVVLHISACPSAQPVSLCLVNNVVDRAATLPTGSMPVPCWEEGQVAGYQDSFTKSNLPLMSVSIRKKGGPKAAFCHSIPSSIMAMLCPSIS